MCARARVCVCVCVCVWWWEGSGGEGGFVVVLAQNNYELLGISISKGCVRVCRSVRTRVLVCLHNMAENPENDSPTPSWTYTY